MHDKVLGFIRETLLHENILDSLSIDLEEAEVRLNLLQPSPDYHQYPDPELLLTFLGVHEIAVRPVGTLKRGVQTIMGMECTSEEGLYRTMITVGDSEAARWSVSLTFSDLRYKRS